MQLSLTAHGMLVVTYTLCVRAGRQALLAKGTTADGAEKY